jgi:large subunit ribosomal protein L3
MTQLFDEKGRVHAGTVLSAGPVTVTQVKGEKDGYTAIQVGYEAQKEARVSRPVLGHTKGKAFKTLREFRVSDSASFAVGATIDVSTFSEGDKVEVAGETKGKGFQGVVKRHGFHGGRRTHGQKHSEREPGSIGGGGRAGGRVVKGMRMAGHMGTNRVVVKGLRVLKVDRATNTLIVSGAVPGHRGTLLEIVST